MGYRYPICGFLGGLLSVGIATAVNLLFAAIGLKRLSPTKLRLFGGPLVVFIGLLVAGFPFPKEPHVSNISLSQLVILTWLGATLLFSIRFRDREGMHTQPKGSVLSLFTLMILPFLDGNALIHLKQGLLCLPTNLSTVMSFGLLMVGGPGSYTLSAIMGATYGFARAAWKILLVGLAVSLLGPPISAAGAALFPPGTELFFGAVISAIGLCIAKGGPLSPSELVLPLILAVFTVTQLQAHPNLPGEALVIIAIAAAWILPILSRILGKIWR